MPYLKNDEIHSHYFYIIHLSIKRREEVLPTIKIETKKSVGKR